MDTEIIFRVNKDPDGGFYAQALGEDIVIQGDTMNEIRANAREAVRCHFDHDAPQRIRCIGPSTEGCDP